MSNASKEFSSGTEFGQILKSVELDGVASVVGENEKRVWFAGEQDLAGEMFLAAGIPRTPGRAEDFLQQVADFSDQTSDRITQIGLFNRIYEAEGLINNSVNKLVSLLATKGSFKVRRVKGKPGMSGDARAQEFAAVLQFWAENVNADADDAVVTGAQGVQDWIAQGARQALVEGGIVARTHWVKAKIPTLKKGTYSLPMNLQTFGGEEIEIPDEVAGTDLQIIYWKPSDAVRKALQGQGQDKAVADALTKLIDKDVVAAIKKDGKYQLDPSLLIHIKHRGDQKHPYGESLVKSAMSSVAYKRALQALDVVTIENLVQRMLILSIGSDDAASPYHVQEVIRQRVLMLQNLLRKVGPSSTIVWPGPDLKAQDVGAASKVMEIDGRLAMVQSMIRGDIGVPAALLTGEGSDGKASGLAATKGVLAQLIELQNRFAKALTTIAKRIAAQNGFEDVDVIWEFSQSILADKTETVTVLQKGYAEGNVSTRTLITDGYGLDYEAEEGRQLEDVEKGYKEEAFGPPKSVLTVNNTGIQGGGGGDGRPTDPTKPDPRDGKEKGATEEQK